ncbi:UNVERIFIED_CONTAM: hypothetical protein HDU68_002493, partial [Siphonaria sp. JEL0065]
RFKNVHAATGQNKNQTFYFGGREVVIKAPDLSDVDINLDQNTGLRFWDASYLLAKYIESLDPPKPTSKKTRLKKHPFYNKTILELGSGTSGLLPLVALSYGAKCVIGTDIDSIALERLDMGVKWNLNRWDGFRDTEDVNSYWGVEELTWGVATSYERVLQRLETMQHDTAESNEAIVEKGFDVIIASEILYLAGQHKNLAKTIRAFCHEETRVYMVHKKRGLGEEGFYRMAKWAGLDCEEVPRELLDAEFVDDLDHVVLEMKLNE